VHRDRGDAVRGPEVSAHGYEARVLRAHVEEEIVIPGTANVDPLRWDPLIMKFCDFFGGGRTCTRPGWPRGGVCLQQLP
jgi:hypothetical protein